MTDNKLREMAGVVQPGKEKTLGRTYCSLSVLKECLQERERSF